MEALEIESLGIFIKLVGDSIYIEGTDLLPFKFRNEILAKFWFDCLVTQIETLDEYTV